MDFTNKKDSVTIEREDLLTSLFTEGKIGVANIAHVNHDHVFVGRETGDERVNLPLVVRSIKLF